MVSIPRVVQNGDRILVSLFNPESGEYMRDDIGIHGTMMLLSDLVPIVAVIVREMEKDRVAKYDPRL